MAGSKHTLKVMSLNSYRNKLFHHIEKICFHVQIVNTLIQGIGSSWLGQARVTQAEWGTTQASRKDSFLSSESLLIMLRLRRNKPSLKRAPIYFYRPLLVQWLEGCITMEQWSTTKECVLSFFRVHSWDFNNHFQPNTLTEIFKGYYSIWLNNCQRELTKRICPDS